MRLPLTVIACSGSVSKWFETPRCMPVVVRRAAGRRRRTVYIGFGLGPLPCAVIHVSARLPFCMPSGSFLPHHLLAVELAYRCLWFSCQLCIVPAMALILCCLNNEEGIKHRSAAVRARCGAPAVGGSSDTLFLTLLETLRRMDSSHVSVAGVPSLPAMLPASSGSPLLMALKRRLFIRWAKGRVRFIVAAYRTSRQQ